MSTCSPPWYQQTMKHSGHYPQRKGNIVHSFTREVLYTKQVPVSPHATASDTGIQQLVQRRAVARPRFHGFEHNPSTLRIISKFEPLDRRCSPNGEGGSSTCCQPASPPCGVRALRIRDFCEPITHRHRTSGVAFSADFSVPRSDRLWLRFGTPVKKPYRQVTSAPIDRRLVRSSRTPPPCTSMPNFLPRVVGSPAPTADASEKEASQFHHPGSTNSRLRLQAR
ncbi:hypothetical protein BR93DRAFT_506888 [Coniochaeta sp. PMI_546]|nr:hypothetical protein BR93DRAFT_506888 [Coniochaeta sp. PMI_546]